MSLLVRSRAPRTGWIAVLALATVAALAGCPHPSPAVPAPPTGRLVVTVSPPGPGIQLTLDGEPMDVPADGTLRLAVTVSRHRVQVERDGYYAVWRLVDVPAPPAEAELRVDLRETVE